MHGYWSGDEQKFQGMVMGCKGDGISLEAEEIFHPGEMKKGEEEGQIPKWFSKYKSIESNELRLNKRKRIINALT